MSLNSAKHRCETFAAGLIFMFETSHMIEEPHSPRKQSPGPQKLPLRQQRFVSPLWEAMAYGWACRMLSTSTQKLCTDWTIYNYKMNLLSWILSFNWEMRWFIASSKSSMFFAPQKNYHPFIIVCAFIIYFKFSMCNWNWDIQHVLMVKFTIVKS